MTVKRKILISAVSIVIILGGIAVTYKIMFSQGKVEPFEINSPVSEQKILIATQGSSFKESLLNGIINNFKETNMYFKIIDISTLSEIDGKAWNAILIINTCQSGSLNSSVENYFKQSNEMSNTVMLITSGSGKWEPDIEGVDTISSASKTEEIDSLVDNITIKLDEILKD